jgi:tetratricopeptide (TPR) repeat protein
MAAIIPLAAGIALVFDDSFRPRPTFEEVCSLAQSGRLEEAEARGEAYLRVSPGDSRALLVMAELALAQPSPDPEKALRRLERIHPDSHSMAAWVRIDCGKAHHLLSRHDRAEACWKEALRLDPFALEAGRRLLDLYTMQGRTAEARELALRQFEHEGDPRERRRLLVRLARIEVDPPEPWSVVNRFEGEVRRGTADLPTTLAYGLALAYVSRGQEAAGILKQALDRNPDDPRAWDGLMTAQEISHQEPELAESFARLPEAMTADPRFARHRGWVEQQAGRWAEAARAYRCAWEYDPDPIVGYRLRRALRFAGQIDEADRYDRIVLDCREAYKQLRAALKTAEPLGAEADDRSPEFCERMAALRGRMRRHDEARAWRRLALRDGAANPGSDPRSAGPSSPVSRIEAPGP